MEIVEMLSNPTIKDAFEQEFGTEKLNELLYGSLTVKDARAMLPTLNMVDTCRLMIVCATLLTGEAFDETLGEKSPLEMGVANLTDKDLKSLMTHITKLDHFKTRSRKTNSTDSSYTEGYTL